MFAILACIVFAVGLFGGHLGSLNLLYLGLGLMALDLAFAWRPWTGLVRRNNPPA